MTKKQIIKIIEIAAIVLIIIGVIVTIILKNITKANVTTSSKIPLDEFTEQLAYDNADKADNLDSVSEAISDAYTDIGIDMSDEDFDQSKEEFDELVDRLDQEGLITYDEDGNLTPEAKAYIAEIASFSYAQNHPDEKIDKGDTLDDIVDTNPSSITIDEIKQNYESVISEYDVETIEDRLTLLENARLENDSEKEQVANLALRINALETSLKAIKNTPVTISETNQDVITECKDDINSLKTEINTIKSNISADNSNPSELTSSVADVNKKIDNMNTKLSNSNSNFSTQLSTLSTKIEEKQTAINNLKKEIAEIESQDQKGQSDQDKKFDTLTSNLKTLQQNLDSSLKDQNKRYTEIKSEITADISSIKKELEKEVNNQLSSSKWLKGIEIERSDWLYDSTKGKYYYQIEDDLISSTYSNIYITYGSESIHNRFTYEQGSKSLTIYSDELPDKTIINSIKIENPR